MRGLGGFLGRGALVAALACVALGACVGTESGNPLADRGQVAASTVPGEPSGSGSLFGDPSQSSAGTGGGLGSPTGTAGTGGQLPTQGVGAGANASAGMGSGAMAGSSAGTGAAAGTGGTAGTGSMGSADPDAGCATVGPQGDAPAAPQPPCCYRKVEPQDEDGSGDDAGADAGLADGGTGVDAVATGAATVDGTLSLDYRVVWSKATNQPASLGSAYWQRAHEELQRLELESLLLSFSLSVQQGAVADGPGTLRVGYGSFDCQGGYSFLMPFAPPTGASSDPLRWAAHDLLTQVAVAGGDVWVSADAAMGARLPPRNVPVADPTAAQPSAEIVYEGFVLDPLSLEEREALCIGELAWDGWSAGGAYETFLPLGANDLAPTVDGATTCAALAFGVPPGAQRCADHPRCVPGDNGCPWVKLPDSLCPDNAAERALFGCHVGWAGNPDGAPARCGASGAQQAGAAASSDGQVGVADNAMSAAAAPCCDPLGEDPALPICNAWRVRYEFVAAAVEIDDSLASSVLRCAP